eukprot:scaffold73466_cov39-Tisochrysis_lutea.AAC.1
MSGFWRERVRVLAPHYLAFYFLRLALAPPIACATGGAQSLLSVREALLDMVEGVCIPFFPCAWSGGAQSRCVAGV